jgi:ATP-binding cassette, subfamily B, bacterial
MSASQEPRAETDAPGWVRRLTGLAWVHRSNILVSFAAAVLGSLGQAVVPLVARKIVDDVIGRDGAPLWPWLVLLVVIAVLVFWLAYLRRYRGGLVGIAVQYDLRNRMHDHLLTLDEQSRSQLSTGQVVARANGDTALVQGLLNFLPLMTGNLLMMLTSLVIMFVLSPLLALVGLVIAPALFVVSYRMRIKIFPATWDGQQREGEVAEVVDEDVNGVRVVKAFGQEERELRRMVGIVQTLYGVRMRANRLQARYQPLLEAIPVLAQVAVLALGGWMALHDQISIGTFLAFSTYVGQFVAPARQLAGVLTVGQQARAGVERIFQLLDLEPQITDAPDAVELPEVRGEIELRGVRFGYGDEPVLDGLDLHIDPGERVALVGGSGSGKSTVTRLVHRLLDPDAGQVLVDGHDLRGVTLHSLRSQVGAAFEESFLFSDTIAANIAYGRPDVSRTEVEDAARIAGAHDFVREMAEGYDTRIGERGLSLSGGQRQRLALARAILSEPRILVLDDATSAVDSSTEAGIFARLRDVLADRTSLIVAHRVSTLSLADRVVLLEHGRVADQGTHAELIARNRAYRELLTGLDDEAAVAVGDSIETLSQVDVTPAAWRRGTGGRAEAVREATERANARIANRPTLGPGLGGGTWRLNLAPTPELLARVEALPPVRDRFEPDLARETVADPDFSIWRLVKEFRWSFGLGLALVILDALCGLAGPYLVRIGVDHGVEANAAHVLWLASAVFLLIAVVDLADQIASTFVTGRTSERIMAGLRIRIWAQLQRLSLDYYEREMAGRIMTRMTTDVDQFETLIENGLLQALVSLVTFAGVGVALLLMDLELALWTMTVIVPLAIATVLFRRVTNRLYDVVREALAVVNADFQESLSGIREAQAFVHEDRTVERFHRLGRRYYDGRVLAQRTIATYFPFVLFLSAIADVIVLGVGAHLIEQGRLSTGVLIAFLLYLTMFFSPIQQLSQVFDSWQQTRVSIGRISDLMRLRTITPDAVDPVPLGGPGEVGGALALHDVHFTYPQAEVVADERGPADAVATGPDVVRRRPPEALRGLDLHVAAHETVALVGETGAGKSTVLKLIARFYDPDSGSVTLDGHDLRTLGLHDFRSRLGYVPQESFLFTGSIRDNIAYGRPGATDAEVEAAARAVGAHDLVATLPGGYLHEISERGGSLSSGQRQLIALARAELVDPAVLLLDEATANLDLATEARVSAAMAAVARRRTTILIAHRLQTARTADRIIVLGQGRVLEEGTHDVLLGRNGRYAAMWRAFELVSAS